MSLTIIVGLGQCGISVGRHLWSRIAAGDPSVRSARPRRFFGDDGKARAVFADAEVKVIRSVAAADQTHRGIFDAANVIVGGNFGSGGNWAKAFGAQNSLPTIVVRILDAIRAEMERADAPPLILILASVGGGTGSGTASRLVQELNDANTRATIVTCAVAPFDGGESPLFNLNAIMTAAEMIQDADAVIAVSNADVVKMIRTRIGAKRGSSIAMSAVNGYIADALCDTVAADADAVAFSEVIANVCPIPNANVVEVWTSAGLTDADANNANNWNAEFAALQNALNSLTATPDVSAANVRTLSYHINARGADGTLITVPRLTERFHKTLAAVEWCALAAPSNRRFVYSATPPVSVTNTRASVSAIINRSRFAHSMEETHRRAAAQLNSRLYVHWYHKFGVDDDMIRDALNTVYDMISDYDQWTR